MADYNGVVPDSPKWQAGSELTSYGYYEITGPLNTGDKIIFTGLLPDFGIKIVQLILETGVIDSTGEYLGNVSVGDSDDPARFIDNISAGWLFGPSRACFGINTPGGFGFKYTEPVPIILEVVGTLDVPEVTGFISLTVRYFCSGRK